ncbi:hypothetical protein Msil_1667 [Methylocella silvestris BL2]|uniref:Uncharacterized protein n=1 Tax=Methylocella silvestris (strain DSM 15510 / CIP 108128 / LMG 27833 / NCIMB 13906 / BL2) TaxID=395965 RepID=B8EK75_METSB|nr:hypothetical protein Msil_1667 [Methylocella silvestris BL2]
MGGGAIEQNMRGRAKHAASQTATRRKNQALCAQAEKAPDFVIEPSRGRDRQERRRRIIWPGPRSAHNLKER